MSKICLKNTNYTCVIAYRCNGQVGLLTHRRYSNPVPNSDIWLGLKNCTVSRVPCFDCSLSRHMAHETITNRNKL